jgi:hypothetical protein
MIPPVSKNIWQACDICGDVNYFTERNYDEHYVCFLCDRHIDGTYDELLEYHVSRANDIIIKHSDVLVRMGNGITS